MREQEILDAGQIAWQQLQKVKLPPLCFESIDESERREWKVGLKLNIHKTKIMASGPITSWQIDGETVETVSDFIFLGSKITVNYCWRQDLPMDAQHVKWKETA